MARIRTIKPEFAHSESMGNVSRDARLLFVLLWSQSDDEGKQRGSPRLLKGVLFPYDDVSAGEIETWLAELVRENCIERYEVDGAHYLRIAKWREHQKIDRPAASKFPDPPGHAAPPREDPLPCEDSSLPREASSDTREPSSLPREASSEAREPSSTDQGSRKGPGPGPEDRGPKEQEPDQGRAREEAATATRPVAVAVPVPVPKPGPTATDPPETEAWRHWQEIARLEGWPEAGFLNSQRRLQLQARLATCGGIEGWKLALEKARDAEFLRAPNGGPQRWFDLDWLLDEQKFTRVMEGRYAERHRNDSKPGDILSALASYGREDDR